MVSEYYYMTKNLNSHIKKKIKLNSLADRMAGGLE
jgi:hypothetical protein